MKTPLTTKLAKARTRLLLSQPFFGSLALRLALIERPTIDTMATDGRAIFYDPGFTDALSMDELTGVLAHEVMHPACQHHTRRARRAPSRWNRAADYAINPILIDNGFTLPEGALLDDAYRGLSAEAIYARLENDSDTGSEGGEDNGAGEGEARACPDPGGCGGVIDAPSGLDERGGFTGGADEWRQAVAQAAVLAKNAGKMTGALERHVDRLLRPKADWPALLRRFLDMSAAHQDYRFSPPNRRFIHQGLYLPSCRGEQMPPMALVIDTSASITQDEFNQFAAELSAIVEDCAPEALHVIYCDSRVQAVDTLTAYDLPLTLEPKGGGGTGLPPPVSPPRRRRARARLPRLPHRPRLPPLSARTRLPDAVGLPHPPRCGALAPPPVRGSHLHRRLTMHIEREFTPASRYAFDTSARSTANGYAQIDTS